MVDEVRAELPELEHVVVLERRTGTTLLAGGDADATSCASARPRCDFDDPINIQYTSGHDRASPRARRSRHHNILNNGYFVGEGCGYTEQDRVCIPVPFYHCFGMVMGNLGCTTHGATMVDPGAGVRPERDAARPSQDERCTSLYGVPTMFIAELEPPATSPTSTCRRCAPGSWPARRARSR